MPAERAEEIGSASPWVVSEQKQAHTNAGFLRSPAFCIPPLKPCLSRKAGGRSITDSREATERAASGESSNSRGFVDEVAAEHPRNHREAVCRGWFCWLDVTRRGERRVGWPQIEGLAQAPAGSSGCARCFGRSTRKLPVENPLARHFCRISLFTTKTPLLNCSIHFQLTLPIHPQSNLVSPWVSSPISTSSPAYVVYPSPTSHFRIPSVVMFTRIALDITC